VIENLYLRTGLKPLCFDGVVFDLDATLVNLGEHVDWSKAQEDVKKRFLINLQNDEVSINLLINRYKSITLIWGLFKILRKSLSIVVMGKRS
jgi:hypothetical protein